MLFPIFCTQGIKILIILLYSFQCEDIISLNFAYQEM